MALYNNERKKYSRVPFQYVEIDIDESTTIRLCSDVSPLPYGIDAIPCLSPESPLSFSPCAVDPNGGLGVRGSVSFTAKDFLDYTIYGSLTAPVSFWPVWYANNLYYQGLNVRAYSGYIAEGNLFDVNAYQARYYVLESFSYSGSAASFTAKDPLKLADNDRTETPTKSTGVLQADITNVATSAILTPAGIGDDEYGTSGWIRIGDEVCSYTRTAASDTLTLVRGVYGTVAVAHSLGDGVQECAYYQDTVDLILYNLLVNRSGIDAAYIPVADWAAEISLYLPNLYEALITEPVGNTTLIKELGEQAPHRLFWDERYPYIQLRAIKPPPSDSLLLSDEGEILENSIGWQVKQDLRISTVVIAYGQNDPTKKLDEFSNYFQPYVREDTDSVTNYGSRRIKTIYSRWISRDNKAAAILLAARLGRRYSNAPRAVNFTLDSKDADVWTGDNCKVNTRTIVDASNVRINIPLEVMSVQEGRGGFKYEALEHLYGDSLAQDEGTDTGSKVLILSGNLDQLKNTGGTTRNLREVFEDVYPTIDPADDCVIVLDGLCVAGSSLQSQYGIYTGDWSDLVTPPLIRLQTGALLVGKGGDANAGNGGGALFLESDIRLDNSGIIGGGGGSGGKADDSSGSDVVFASGGGGAGYFSGQVSSTFGKFGGEIQAQEGTNTLGGAGGQAFGTFGEAIGGDGGNLGDAGSLGTPVVGSAGLAGAAIDTNGYTITYITTGDIRGAIL